MKTISCFFVLMLLVLTKSSLARVPQENIDAYKEILFANLHFIYTSEEEAKHTMANASDISRAGTGVAHAEIERIFKAAGLAAHAAAAGVEKIHQEKVRDAAYVSSIAHEILRTADKVVALNEAELNAVASGGKHASGIVDERKADVQASRDGAHMAYEKAMAAAAVLHAALDSHVAGPRGSGAGPSGSQAPQEKFLDTGALQVLLHELRGKIITAHHEHQVAMRTKDAANSSLVEADRKMADILRVATPGSVFPQKLSDEAVDAQRTQNRAVAAVAVAKKKLDDAHAAHDAATVAASAAAAEATAAAGTDE